MTEKTIELSDRTSTVNKSEKSNLQPDVEAQVLAPEKKSMMSQILVPFQERHPLEYYTVVFGGACLAFNAGYINGITFQFAGVGVSYVTGTSLKIGVNSGLGDWYKVGVGIGYLFSFIFGSVITGYFMPSDSFKLGRFYGPLFLIGGMFFLIAFTLSYKFPTSDFYLFFAATGCGVQNSMTTKYSGNIIRTAHMSGAATDMGLICGRYLKKGRKAELWKLTVFIPMVTSFICGGIASVPAYKRLGKKALMVNVVLFFFIGVAYSIVVGRKLHVPAWKAFFGLYERLKETSVAIRQPRRKLPKNIRDSEAFNALHSTYLRNLKQLEADERARNESMSRDHDDGDTDHDQDHHGYYDDDQSEMSEDCRSERSDSNFSTASSITTNNNNNNGNGNGRGR